MKRILVAATMLVTIASASAQNVGVSVTVDQPGLYGRIDIGHVPTPPVLIYPQPVVIQQTPVVMRQQPILSAIAVRLVCVPLWMWSSAAQ